MKPTGWPGVYWEGDIWAKIWMKVEACMILGGNVIPGRDITYSTVWETDDVNVLEKKEITHFSFPFEIFHCRISPNPPCHQDTKILKYYTFKDRNGKGDPLKACYPSFIIVPSTGVTTYKSVCQRWDPNHRPSKWQRQGYGWVRGNKPDSQTQLHSSTFPSHHQDKIKNTVEGREIQI